ncbi:hypothetical protein FIE12Z_847 [Fusarium flagelliforme]|uniref:Uncharacterized protein n=1 Tax=Fusarium flagelliforme TaxID=2675880 RepID=A0A395N4M9_9HYPO|nr:hypothetical protein FIE12Z_847 [Fusarium flagelliforme]
MNKLSSAIWTPSAPTSLAVVALLIVRNIGSDSTARVNRLISAHEVLQFTGQAIDQYDPTERANPVFIGVKPGTLLSETAQLAKPASNDADFILLQQRTQQTVKMKPFLKDKLMELTKTVTTTDWVHENSNWLDPFLQSQSPTDEAIYYDKLSKSFNEKTVALVPKEHRQRIILALYPSEARGQALLLESTEPQPYITETLLVKEPVFTETALSSIAQDLEKIALAQCNVSLGHRLKAISDRMFRLNEYNQSAEKHYILKQEKMNREMQVMTKQISMGMTCIQGQGSNDHPAFEYAFKTEIDAFFRLLTAILHAKPRRPLLAIFEDLAKCIGGTKLINILNQEARRKEHGREADDPLINIFADLASAVRGKELTDLIQASDVKDYKKKYQELKREIPKKFPGLTLEQATEQDFEPTEPAEAESSLQTETLLNSGGIHPF